MTMRVRQKKTFGERGRLSQNVSTRRVKGFKTSGRRRRTFMSIAKSTGKGMRSDKKTMRVKGGACRIRRWMRPGVGSEGICRGRGHTAGT